MDYQNIEDAARTIIDGYAREPRTEANFAALKGQLHSWIDDLIEADHIDMVPYGVEIGEDAGNLIVEITDYDELEFLVIA